MPHCIIEHAQGLEPQPLMDAVYAGALSSGLFSAKGIKLRTLSYAHFQTGDARQAFVHVAVKILSGRSAEQKAELSRLVLAELEKLSLKEDASAELSLTVEIIDIDKVSYAKLVV